MKSSIVLTSLCFSFSALAHQIIYLIAPPRSLSTACVRMMEARGDHAVLSEPAQYAWVRERYADSADALFNEQSVKTFDAVAKELATLAQQKPVFVKEISYVAQEFIRRDAHFAKSCDVQFVFLVRNPHHALISLYNRRKGAGHTDAPNFDAYQALYDLFMYLKNVAHREPLILCAEDLYNSPESTVKNFCSSVRIPFLEKSLSWDDASKSYDASRWQEAKKKEVTLHWHGEALRSTQFKKPASYAVDEHGNPTFIEIDSPELRTLYMAAYKESSEYYALLLSHAKNVIQP